MQCKDKIIAGSVCAEIGRAKYIIA